MAKFTPKNLNSGFADVDSLNENFTSLEQLSDSWLSRDGTAPNSMQSNIDMNSQRIINLPNAVAATEPVTLSQLNDVSGTAGFVSTISEQIVATAGQTVFNLVVIAYTPGVDNISVYRNGAFVSTGDYAQTDADTVTFTFAAIAGDEYDFVVNQRNVEAGTTPASSTTYDAPTDEVVAGATNVKAYLDVADKKIGHLHPVTEFGTVGDGVANDTAAVQAAFNTAGHITLVEGQVYLCDKLTLVSGLTVSGKGEIKLRSNLTTGGFISGDGISNVTLRDFTINTNKATNTNVLTALFINNTTVGTDITVDGIFVNGSTSAGIQVDSTARVSIINNRVTDVGVGDAIRCSICSQVDVSNNKLYNLLNIDENRRAIQVGTCINFVIANNQIRDMKLTNPGYAVDLGGSSFGSVTGNTAFNVNGGIDIENGSANIQITGNNFQGPNTGTPGHGIFFVDITAGTQPIDISVSGNTFFGFNQGLRVEGVSRLVVSGNSFTNMRAAGINVIDGPLTSTVSDDILVNGNLVRQTVLAGGGNAISIKAASSIVTDNVIRGGSFGFALSDNSANGNMQVGNNIMAAGTGGRFQKLKLFPGNSVGGENMEFYGNGTPLGAVTAVVGSRYYRLDGGTGTSLYIKESDGTGSAGWIGK